MSNFALTARCGCSITHWDKGSFRKEDATLDPCPLHGAAPELLEACKRLLKFNEELCRDVKVSTHYPSADFARQAIAKAESTS